MKLYHYDFIKNYIRTIIHLYVQIRNLDALLTPHPEIYRWILDLHVKSKLSGVKHKEILHECEVGKDLLNRNQKVITIRRNKMYNLNLH